MGAIDDYAVLYGYYSGRRESILKNDIKKENNIFRKKTLEQIYIELKRINGFKKK